MNEMTKVSQDTKIKLWIERIHACKSSGLSARQWCKDNDISEQTYYKWVKKLKLMGIDNILVKKPTFVSVPTESVRSSNAEMIVISKGDISKAEHIYIATGYTDMRKAIDGLTALVQ